MMGTINGLMTLLLIILFLGIWVWAWSARNKDKFAEMAHLPLEDDAEGSSALNKTSKENRSEVAGNDE